MTTNDDKRRDVSERRHHLLAGATIETVHVERLPAGINGQRPATPVDCIRGLHLEDGRVVELRVVALEDDYAIEAIEVQG